jgi:hypothetical protein
LLDILFILLGFNAIIVAIAIIRYRNQVSTEHHVASIEPGRSSVNLSTRDFVDVDGRWTDTGTGHIAAGATDSSLNAA